MVFQHEQKEQSTYQIRFAASGWCGVPPGAVLCRPLMAISSESEGLCGAGAREKGRLVIVQLRWEFCLNGLFAGVFLGVLRGLGRGVAVGAVVFLCFDNVWGQSIPVDSVVFDASSSVTVRGAGPDGGRVEVRPPGIGVDDFVAGGPGVSLAVPVGFDSELMMGVEELRPGMKGYGLTVFSGLRPERFEAEVIGVRHRMFAGTDIILCRLSSPHLEGIGVVAGMSGSPVYVDGRLIGAVAYGFLDVDDPLAGVTPIEEMLKVYNSTPTEGQIEASDDVAGGFGQGAFSDFMALRADPSLENLRRVAMPVATEGGMTLRAAEFGADVAERFGLPESFRLEPLSAPVVVAGSSGASAELARTVFPQMNVLAAEASVRRVATGEGGVSSVVPFDDVSVTSGLNPSAGALSAPGGPVEDLGAFAEEISGGYALAVPLVEGDLNMAVVGTVSWRLNERLVAFGHPMMKGGSVHLPMAAARINALVRSRTRPFKLGEPVGHVGMIRQDRVPAVGGLFGMTARMFPLSARVNDSAYLGKREFQFRIWSDRHMSPGLLVSALGETVGTAARIDGDSAALYGYTMYLDDGTSISVADYRSDVGGSLRAIIGVMADVGMVLNNPFKRVHLTDMDFEIRVIDRLREAALESATTDKGTYRPGEMVTVEWLVRPFREEPVRLTWDFVVPRDLPDGSYTIAVMDASTREAIERRRHPGGNKVSDFDDVRRVLERNFASNRIYIALVDQDTGVSVTGKEMPRLPGSIINLVQETVDPEYFSPVRGNFVLDADLVTNYQISGDVKATIKVERR